MLQLTRLSGPTFALNPDLIERAEATPDTVVTLVNGSKYVIRESLDELVELVRAYRAELVLIASKSGLDATATPVPSGRHAGRDTRGGNPPGTHGTVVPLRAEHGEA